MRPVVAWLFLAASLAVSGQARAQFVYNSSGQLIWGVNPSTGAATFTGGITFNSTVALTSGNLIACAALPIGSGLGCSGGQLVNTGGGGGGSGLQSGGTGDASSLTSLTTGSTTARSFAARGLDWLNVKDCGAKLDGVTNDTPAINACIALMSPGQTLFFPPGGINLSATPTVPAGVGPIVIQMSGNTYGTGTQPIIDLIPNNPEVTNTGSGFVYQLTNNNGVTPRTALTVDGYYYAFVNSTSSVGGDVANLGTNCSVGAPTSSTTYGSNFIWCNRTIVHDQHIGPAQDAGLTTTYFKDPIANATYGPNGSGFAFYWMFTDNTNQPSDVAGGAVGGETDLTAAYDDPSGYRIDQHMVVGRVLAAGPQTRVGHVISMASSGGGVTPSVPNPDYAGTGLDAQGLSWDTAFIDASKGAPLVSTQPVAVDEGTAGNTLTFASPLVGVTNGAAVTAGSYFPDGTTVLSHNEATGVVTFSTSSNSDVPGPTSFTGSISGTTLTVTAGTVTAGEIFTGSANSDVNTATKILAFGTNSTTGTGGTGTYALSISQTVASETITASTPVTFSDGAIAPTIRIGQPEFIDLSGNNSLTVGDYGAAGFGVQGTTPYGIILANGTFSSGALVLGSTQKICMDQFCAITTAGSIGTGTYNVAVSGTSVLAASTTSATFPGTVKSAGLTSTGTSTLSGAVLAGETRIVTGNDTASSSDCGGTILVNATTATTETIPSGLSSSPPCRIVVSSINTGIPTITNAASETLGYFNSTTSASTTSTTTAGSASIALGGQNDSRVIRQVTATLALVSAGQ